MDRPVLFARHDPSPGFSRGAWLSPAPPPGAGAEFLVAHEGRLTGPFLALRDGRIRRLGDDCSRFRLGEPPPAGDVWLPPAEVRKWNRVFEAERAGRSTGQVWMERGKGFLRLRWGGEGCRPRALRLTLSEDEVSSLGALDDYAVGRIDPGAGGPPPVRGSSLGEAILPSNFRRDLRGFDRIQTWGRTGALLGFLGVRSPYGLRLPMITQPGVRPVSDAREKRRAWVLVSGSGTDEVMRREADSVASFFRRAGATTCLLPAIADPGSLHSALRSARWVHCAGHGETRSGAFGDLFRRVEPWGRSPAFAFLNVCHPPPVDFTRRFFRGGGLCLIRTRGPVPGDRARRFAESFYWNWMMRGVRIETAHLAACRALAKEGSAAWIRWELVGDGSLHFDSISSPLRRPAR